MDKRLDKRIERLFVIGAGASADAGIALGKDLLREILMKAITNTNGFNLATDANKVISRLKLIYPEFEFGISGSWPNFEQYLDLIYDFNKTSRLLGVSTLFDGRSEFDELRKGIDKEAVGLLYWYLFTACWGWAAERSNSYLKLFVDKEVTPFIERTAIISLNYEWLFERACAFSIDKTDVNYMSNRNEPWEMGYIYGEKSEISFFKPHGSANLVICDENEDIEITQPLDLSKSIIKASKFFDNHILCEEGNLKMYYGAVLMNTPDASFKTQERNIFNAIVPPWGTKGTIGPVLPLKFAKEKDDDNSLEYKLLTKFIENETNGTMKIIDKVEREIWLVGTCLLVDLYLFNQIILKRLITPEILIKYISPDFESAKILAKKLGKILFYKGTLYSYSEKIKNNIEPEFISVEPK
jgi:hypothetical protein